MVCSLEKKDLIPKEVNARTRVHEYGGVPYWIAPGGALYYTNFKDQRLYVIKSEGAEPECLTPSTAYEGDCRYRFADCIFDMQRERIICVREDHTNPTPSEALRRRTQPKTIQNLLKTMPTRRVLGGAEVKNAIASVSLDGTGKMAAGPKSRSMT